MKRVVSWLLSTALLLGALSACRAAGPSASPGRDWAVGELAELAFAHSGRKDMDGLEEISAETDREWVTAYIENAYGIQEAWEDAAVIRATGASAFEIAVLRMEDGEAAVRAGTALMSYIFARQGDFTGYAPAEADMVGRGSIMQDGPFAALFICPDPEGAYEIVEAALSGEYDPDQPEPSQEIIAGVKELRDFLVTRQGMDGVELERLDDSDPDALADYMRDAYGLSPDQWEECAIARGTGDSAFEVAVVQVQTGRTVFENVEQRLNVYLNDREAQFDSSTEQAKLLHRAIVAISSPYLASQYNQYVVLLVCQDAEDTAVAFVRAATGSNGYGYSRRYRYLDTDPGYPDRCAFTAPNKDDMSLYDTSAILAAWEKGDPSGLSGYDGKIYEQAQKVLKTVLKDGMSGYEKEVALYNWVVQSVDYDWTHQDRMKHTPRESFTPYGGLVNRTAVCLGYAATFQLLCDLAGMECITVPGAAFSSESDHAWNMVRLNGEWYCVDATWDAGDRQENWNYFNVTSDYMADTDHQWDYANTPEATAEDRGRG